MAASIVISSALVSVRREKVCPPFILVTRATNRVYFYFFLRLFNYLKVGQLRLISSTDCSANYKAAALRLHMFFISSLEYEYCLEALKDPDMTYYVCGCEQILYVK